MATIGTNLLTLADWAKRLDPNGTTADIVELLSMTNHILTDMLFKEGNLPTGDRTTVRTGLPTVAWRLLNKGIAKSKSTTAQIDESCGILEARSEIDKDLCELNGNQASFRLGEAQSFIEAMNKEMAETLFYGNSGTAPEEFTGLSIRYSSLSAANGQNILSAGGSGSDNSSVWLVCWGANTAYGIFPKGSKAGLIHEDLGLIDALDADNNKFRAYADWWQWKCGLALRDWRFVSRISNIDISDLLAITGTQATTASTFLLKLMARAIDRIPSPGMGKLVFYANRTVMSNLRVLAMEKTGSVLSIEEGLNQFGEKIQLGLKFLGIPIRPCDSLLENESVVS